MRMKRSEYDAAIVQFHGDKVAIEAFSEGIEVLPDTHAAFQPPTPKPAAPAAPARQPDDLSDAIARIMEQTGADEPTATRQARRADAVRRGQAIDPEDMTASEVKAALASADPEAFREWVLNGSPQADLTDEQVADMLAAQEARLQGGVVKRREGEATAEQTAAYRRWLQENLAYTAEQAAAVTMPTVAKQAPKLSAADEFRAANVTRADMGLPEVE